MARIYVDGKYLGYCVDFGSLGEKESDDCGLWSSDGISTTNQALKFAKAKVFDSPDDSESLPFWTGNIEVKFDEIFESGETKTHRPRQNKWDGGDVGFVMGQTDPKKKGVMSTQGNIVETEQLDRVRKLYTEGQVLASIKLH